MRVGRRLLIRPGAIGDFIVSLPALEFLKAPYTEIWTTEANLPIARFADKAVSIYATGLDVFGLGNRESVPGLVDRLRTFDSIVSWYGTKREDFRDAVARLNLPIEFHTALPSDAGGIHACDFYLNQVGAPCGGTPSIATTAVPRKYTVIHPFSGSARKNWPLANFRQLALTIKGELVWTAGPDEELQDAVRFDNLFELAKWLAGARLYIGNDSGISHLAAAVGTPSIVLFGPTNSDVWAPRGPNVRVIKSEDSNIASIEIGKVLQVMHSQG